MELSPISPIVMIPVAFATLTWLAWSLAWSPWWLLV